MTLKGLSRSQIYALALAAGALAIVAIFLNGVIVNPILSKQARISELQTRVASLQSAQARLGDIERWRAARAQSVSVKELFVDAPTSATGVAAVQGVLRSEAAGAGVVLRGAQPFDARVGDLDYVGVRVGFSGNLSQIASFISALETSNPIIFVQSVEMRRGRQDNGEPTIDATASIAAPVWPGEAQS